jgi:hypothetical protein
MADSDLFRPIPAMSMAAGTRVTVFAQKILDAVNRTDTYSFRGLAVCNIC